MEESSLQQSEQEISLIDILWRQDIDLGVEREMFGAHFHERDEDAQRVRGQENEKRKSGNELEKTFLTLGKLDKETGEMLPRCLSQNPQEADESTTFDPWIEFIAETFLNGQTPPPPLVSLGDAHSTPSSQGSPITQNPLLSALLLSKQPPAEKEKASIELLPLPDLQHYLELLEAHVPESPREPLVKTMDNHSHQLPEPQEENTETATVFGVHPEIEALRYNISDGSQITHRPSEQILPKATDPKQTFSTSEDDTEFLLDTIMSTFSPDNLNQICLSACELSSGVQRDLFSEHVNTTAPEPLLCQREVTKRDSLYVTDEMTLFNLEGSKEPIDLDMSLYGDDTFSTNQSEAEDSQCVRSDSAELFDLSLLSEPVDLQSPTGPPSETETSPHHLTQDESYTETYQSELSAPPDTHTGPSCETEKASQPQQGHHSWRVCRDQQRAQTLNLPFSVDNIISMSVEAFNEAISTCELNEAQLNLMRDIRRRGKNKMAAQSCRKRKLNSLVDLEAEVEALRDESERGMRERDRNVRALRETREKLNKLYAEVFSQVRDEHGNPYNPKEYALQYSADGRVFLLPHKNKHT